MLRVDFVLIVATFATIVQCQMMTLLNSTSSYLAYEGLEIEPEGAIALTLRTYQLNATVLYMQGINETFVYLHLVNGRMSLTVNDGDDTKTIALPNPYNTNGWVRVQVIFTTGIVQLMGNDGTESVNINRQVHIMSPIFIGGTPETPPFSITNNLVLDNAHLVGCVRRVQLSNGTTNTESANATDQSSDVIEDDCSLACPSLDCSPAIDSEGQCVEYYTQGICDCRGVFDSEGPLCDEAVDITTLDGISYKCYTLPQYDSPFVEDENIRLFARTPPPSGTLMTGRSGDYQFFLYIKDDILHYEALQGNTNIVSVAHPQNIGVGTLEVHRTVDMVELSIIDVANVRETFATGNITLTEFGSVQFLDICVGGTTLNSPLYSGPLQEIYYNLYHLSPNAFNERNVSKINRVNLVDSDAQITLPGNLGDGSTTHIELQFRTAQQNALLLHAESENNFFRLAINNSKVVISLLVDDRARASTCNLTITPTTWYSVSVEPMGGQGSDIGGGIGVTVSSPDASAQCEVMSLIIAFNSTPVVVGGGAGGMDGLIGCVEVMLNIQPVNLGAVLSDIIQANGCQACDIATPCLNEGICQPLDDRTFNCSCIDPYRGDYCEITPSTLEMTSSMIMTTTTISTTTSISMVTMATTSSDTMVATSSIATTPTPSAADNGGDDSDVGTIIGIILAIIVGVLLIILVILIIIVVIRNRNNRQGFYPTGEGKGGEEMILKYSASLRSITRSGAGAGGTENGGTINKATKKEQEYYI